jgi:Dit-like tail protein
MPLPTLPSTRNLQRLLQPQPVLGEGAQRLSVFSRRGITTAQGTLVLDATLSEAHSVEVEATEHPVESGVNIVDHLRPKPRTLTLEGVVSDTPLADPQDGTQEVRYRPPAKGAEEQVLFAKPRYEKGRAKSAWEHLLALKDSGELVTIATYLAEYKSMALVKLDSTRDAKTGDAVRFTATFREVRIVTLKRETLQSLPKANAKKDLGKKATKPTEAAVDNRTVAKKAFDALVGLVKGASK